MIFSLKPNFSFLAIKNKKYQKTTVALQTLSAMFLLTHKKRAHK